MASRIGHLHFKTAVSQLKATVSLLSGGSPLTKNLIRNGNQSLFLESITTNVRKLHASLALEATYPVNMPSLSPTMTEGTIVKWMVKEGDKIAPGDVLCEIQTDKAVMSMEWEEEAVLAKILMPENSVDVKVGTLIALTVDTGDDWKNAKAPGGGGGGGGSAAPSGDTSKANDSSPSADAAMAKGVNRVNMPSLSPTMTEGTIVKWLMKEGDKITAGDVLCEIQTDKAVVSLEWDEDGVLAKILVPENTADVKVGAMIALTVDEGVEWKNVQVPSSAAASDSSGTSPPAAEYQASGESVMVQGVNRVNMPSLSPTMTEGTIVKWMVKEGDKIAPGDVLCEIQTDKAVMSMEWDEDAVLAKILVPENTADVKVGAMIALTVDEGIDWKTVAVPSESAGSHGSSPPVAAPSKASPPSPVAHSPGTSRLIGPAVQNYLRKYGLNASQVNATGPHGLVIKGDVLKHVLTNKIQAVAQDGPKGSDAGAAAAGAPSPKGVAAISGPKQSKKGKPASFIEIEVTNMRRTIAKRLLQSKSTIPHAYGTTECDVSKMNIIRKKLAGEGLKVSVNDIIIKCAGTALARVPAVNCVWEKDNLIQKGSVDICVAVATPNGLITPIVFSASEKDVAEISENVKALAAKARDGKLQPAEFMGGSFSVSNLGMFGIYSFSAIINPPQCAILAVGGNSVSIDETGKPKTTVKLQLSYDARAIDEEDVAKFLCILKKEIENADEVSMGFSDLRARNWN